MNRLGAVQLGMPNLLYNPSPDEGHGSQLLRQSGHSQETTEFHSPIPKGYKHGHHRYVVVIGTVMSGLGKGIFSSSLAKLLKDKGLTIAPIKMEGYLNIDSGTLNPFRHGEVFVLDDGTECDMDLGTYERMLDQNLSKRNFVTSGQIYADILQRERKGGFLGRDVQMIPHVTGQVKLRLRELAATGGADGAPADVVFIEVGGTAGDYENSLYIEALRELAFEEGPNSVCFVALTYVIEPAILGEQKSKAAQLGIKRLMEAGIQPQILACRARHPVNKTVMQKIAMYSNVPMNRVMSLHDRDSIYTIPEAIRAAGMDREVLSILNLHNRVDAVHEDKARRVWAQFNKKISAKRKHKITIGITGKYTTVRDAYASIDRAIEHSCTHLSAEPQIKWIDTSDITRQNVAESLEDVHAIIVPGGFGERGVEGKIACVEHVRKHRLPYIGICLGFQVAVIEYARNVLGLSDANSSEFDAKCAHAVICELPDQRKIEGLGGTMRLGAQDVLIEKDSLAWSLFEPGKSAMIPQRFRHRYEVDPQYIDQLQEGGMRFSGKHLKYPIMQVLELPASVHPYFIAGQFHPELTSRPIHPHPMFMGLIANAIKFTDPDAAGENDPTLARWVCNTSEGCCNEQAPPPPESASESASESPPQSPIVHTRPTGGVTQA